MDCVNSPGSVSATFFSHDSQGRFKPLIICVAKTSDDIQPYEDVIVVMGRIVKPKPWCVAAPLPEQSPFKVEFCAVFD